MGIEKNERLPNLIKPDQKSLNNNNNKSIQRSENSTAGSSSKGSGGGGSGSGSNLKQFQIKVTDCLINKDVHNKKEKKIDSDSSATQSSSSKPKRLIEPDVDPVKNRRENEIEINVPKRNNNEEIGADEDDEEDLEIKHRIAEEFGDDDDGHNAPRYTGGYIKRKDAKQCFPWTRGRRYYMMHNLFMDPRFQSQFVAKMFLVKAIQWFTALVWTMIVLCNKSVAHFVENNFWTVYTAIVICVINFICVRTTKVARYTSGQISSILIYVCCLSYICGGYFISEQTPLVPIGTGTLAFTFLYFSIKCYFCIVDFSKNIICCDFILVQIVFSLIIAFFYYTISDFLPNNKYFGKLIISYWLPALFISQTLSLLEIIEIQKIVSGQRMTLNPNDWIIASVFIL